MAGLLRDRYFEYAPNRAWDLVTGEAVSTGREDGEDRASEAPPAAYVELLEHGAEGSPRRFTLDLGRLSWREHQRMAAAEARRRGYVAVALDVFFRIRLLLVDELRTRAMVLIARPDAPPDVTRIALLHAAAMSSGPHVLLTTRGSGRVSKQWRVAEARATYSSTKLHAVARTSHSREIAELIDRADRADELVRRGRHAAAERVLREAAAALVRRGASGPAAGIYITLGRMLLERGGVSSADAAFSEAAVLAEGTEHRLAVSARLWQAAARTDGGQLAAAESLCRAVLITDPGDEERARAEAALGRVLSWQGRIGDAAPLTFLRTPSASPYVEATAIRVILEGGDLFHAGNRARGLLTATATGDAASRVIALCAHLRVLLAAGDLALAEEGLRSLTEAARSARMPLRLARMRLLWSEALRRAGNVRAADRELRSLTRLRSALPALLRTAIDRSLKTPLHARSSKPQVRPGATVQAADLVELAQSDEDDRSALRKICGFVQNAVRAARVELCTENAGAVTAVITCGAGLPTRLGQRALESGSLIGPEVVESGWELAMPVRLGTRIVGALTVRWPADRTSGDDAAGIVNLACAVAAPRVESLTASARESAVAATAIPELVGVSAAMTEVRRAVTRAASAPFAVLIEGESGVGKELVARAIHQLGPRRDRRFCDVNCAALPDDLLESELFGHARGAFTGAVSDRAGLVEEADGGTLFLDEVADLSARAQAKLLRVVQQQEVRRVGETFSRKIEVRLVSAANRDLRGECEQGRFRQDLLYRLDVIRVRIPSLRERPEDIPALTKHFWRAAAERVNTQASLSHGVLAALARYHWPGNVRELQNVLSALAVAAPSRGQVRAALLPAVITGATPVTSDRLSAARSQWERRFVEVALARAGGSRSRAARDLGLSRQGLLKILERLRLS